MRIQAATGRLSVCGRFLLGVATVTVLLSGCAGPGGTAQGEDAAEIVDGFDCLAPNLYGWLLPLDPAKTPDPEHPDVPEAGRVPVGFTPTTAVRCDQPAIIEDAEGQWDGVTAVTLTGDLTPLLAALAEPDDGPWPGACTADMELVPPLWLVDATGRAINAHYPRNGCGKTKAGVHDALAALTVQETTTLKRTLTTPRAALDSGCAPEWTAPFDQGALLAIPSGALPGIDEGSSPPSTPIPVPRGPTVPVPTGTDDMRWCRYAVEPAPSEAEPSADAMIPGTYTLRTGRFVAGGMLDPVAARLVAGLAASEPVPRSCDATATMFLAIWPSRGGHELGTVFTAELDGCGLLYSDGTGTHPLPDEMRELLTAQTITTDDSPVQP